MSISRINIRVRRYIQKLRQFSTAVQENEYTSMPEYPPILDTSSESKQKREKEAKHEAIRNVKTVEEKQIKLNMPKYYGFKCYMLRDDYVPYNTLTLAQHVTRTHFIESDVLPSFYDSINVDDFCDTLKADIEEAILMELEQLRESDKKDELTPIDRENLLTSLLSKQIHRAIVSTLLPSYQHLKELEVESDSRIESFWFAGGMNPPENIKKYRLGNEWRKHTENDPTDRAIQYIGNPALIVRSELPLNLVIPFSEAENEDFKVPYFKYDPRVVATFTEHRHGSNIPGFWPGEKKQFGILSLNNRSVFLERQFGDAEEHREALHRQGILSSFAWLNAQANFLGFTTFNDITYPLVTQTCITNGKLWSFYVYQMNTMLVHGEHVSKNIKRNICWGTPELKLYEEITEGKLVGFNTDVLKMLLKLYANKPQEMLGVNLRPYLGNEEKVIADYSDDDKRQWLEREYKFLVSNRPRMKLDYEVYNWEKIYKIDHQTRFMEKRLRPFELFKKPSDRKLNERQAFYIPRALRPDLPRHKGRYAKEYFP